MKLDPTLTESIEFLNTFFQTKKIHYVLVGAMVPLILIELKDNEGMGFGMRETKDLDYIIKVEDWQKYKKIKKELIQHGFSQKKTEPEHRFFFNDIPVDLIPYGKNILDHNQLIWPQTGKVMNMQGIKSLFKYARKVKISENLIINMIPLPLSIYNKILTYLDRKFPRDLEDIMYMLIHYEEIQFSERRYQKDVPIRINYELRGAYLIGSDLRILISEHEITKIEPFFDLFHDPYDAFLEKVAQRQLSDHSDKEGNNIIDLIKTFKQGLGIHS